MNTLSWGLPADDLAMSQEVPRDKGMVDIKALRRCTAIAMTASFSEVSLFSAAFSEVFEAHHAYVLTVPGLVLAESAHQTLHMTC